MIKPHHPAIRIIAAILIATSIVYDIAWAHPDGIAPRQENTNLAPTSFFRDSVSVEKVYARVLEEYIEERSGIDRDHLLLSTVKHIITSHQDEKWFIDNVHYREREGEAVITFAGAGYAVRYYDPEAVGAGERSGEVITSVRLNTHLIKELVSVPALAAPFVPTGAEVQTDDLAALARAHAHKDNAAEAERIETSLKVVKALAEPVCVTFVMGMFNEERRLNPRTDENTLGEDALRAKVDQLETLRRVNPLFSWRLIFVDDGSPGARSARCVERLWNEVRAEYAARGIVLARDLVTADDTISPEEKKALKSRKGGAVIRGMRRALAAARADMTQKHYIGYTDVDVSTNLMQTGLLIDTLLSGRADVAFGSRWCDGGVGVDVPLMGRISSKVYNWATQLILPPLRGVHDTQRAFKLFTEETLADILDYTHDTGFAFDTELLLLARLAGHSLEEVPIAWFDSPEASTLSTSGQSMEMLRHLVMQRAYLAVPQTMLRTRLVDLTTAVAVMEHGGPLKLRPSLNLVVLNLEAISADDAIDPAIRGEADRLIDAICAIARVYSGIGNEVRDVGFALTEKADLEAAIDDLGRRYRKCINEIDVLMRESRHLAAGVPLSIADGNATLKAALAIVDAQTARIRRNMAIAASYLDVVHRRSKRISLREWLPAQVWETKVKGAPAVTAEVGALSEASDLMVSVDPDLLHTAIERIVSNGFHVMSREGIDMTASPAATIGASPLADGRHVAIEIMTPGHIEKSKLAYLPGVDVQKLFMLDFARPDFNHGVGLPFTMRSILKLGGTIRAENVTVHGRPSARFTITLPLDETVAPEGASVSAGSTRTQSDAGVYVGTNFFMPKRWIRSDGGLAWQEIRRDAAKMVSFIIALGASRRAHDEDAGSGSASAMASHLSAGSTIPVRLDELAMRETTVDLRAVLRSAFDRGLIDATIEAATGKRVAVEGVGEIAYIFSGAGSEKKGIRQGSETILSTTIEAPGGRMTPIAIVCDNHPVESGLTIAGQEFDILHRLDEYEPGLFVRPYVFRLADVAGKAFPVYTAEMVPEPYTPFYLVGVREGGRGLGYLYERSRAEAVTADREVSPERTDEILTLLVERLAGLQIDHGVMVDDIRLYEGDLMIDPSKDIDAPGFMKLVAARVLRETDRIDDLFVSLLALRDTTRPFGGRPEAAGAQVFSVDVVVRGIFRALARAKGADSARDEIVRLCREHRPGHAEDAAMIARIVSEGGAYPTDGLRRRASAIARDYIAHASVPAKEYLILAAAVEDALRSAVAGGTSSVYKQIRAVAGRPRWGGFIQIEGGRSGEAAQVTLRRVAVDEYDADESFVKTYGVPQEGHSMVTRYGYPVIGLAIFGAAVLAGLIALGGAGYLGPTVAALLPATASAALPAGTATAAPHALQASMGIVPAIIAGLIVLGASWRAGAETSEGESGDRPVTPAVEYAWAGRIAEVVKEILAAESEAVDGTRPGQLGRYRCQMHALLLKAILDRLEIPSEVIALGCRWKESRWSGYHYCVKTASGIYIDALPEANPTLNNGFTDPVLVAYSGDEKYDEYETSEREAVAGGYAAGDAPAHLLDPAGWDAGERDRIVQKYEGAIAALLNDFAMRDDSLVDPLPLPQAHERGSDREDDVSQSTDRFLWGVDGVGRFITYNDEKVYEGGRLVSGLRTWRAKGYIPAEVDIRPLSDSPYGMIAFDRQEGGSTQVGADVEYIAAVLNDLAGHGHRAERVMPPLDRQAMERIRQAMTFVGPLLAEYHGDGEDREKVGVMLLDEILRRMGIENELYTYYHREHRGGWGAKPRPLLRTRGGLFVDLCRGQRIIAPHDVAAYDEYLRDAHPPSSPGNFIRETHEEALADIWARHKDEIERFTAETAPGELPAVRWWLKPSFSGDNPREAGVKIEEALGIRQEVERAYEEFIASHDGIWHEPLRVRADALYEWLRLIYDPDEGLRSAVTHSFGDGEGVLRYAEQVHHPREILEHGIGNCTAFTALYLVLARRLGVPAVYLNVYEEEWEVLDRSGAPETIRVQAGHVVALFEDGDESIIYDLTQQSGKRITMAYKASDAVVPLLIEAALIADDGNRLQEALDLERQIASRDPDNPAFLTNIGTSYIAMGALDPAIAVLRHAVEIEPRFAAAWSDLGIAYARKGDLDVARSCAERALQEAPFSVQAMLNKGRILYDTGDSAGAEEMAGRIYEAAMKTQLSYGTGFRTIGLLQRHMHNHLAALEAFYLAREQLGGDRDGALAQWIDELERAIGEEHTPQVGAVICQKRREHAKALMSATGGDRSGQTSQGEAYTHIDLRVALTPDEISAVSARYNTAATVIMPTPGITPPEAYAAPDEAAFLMHGVLERQIKAARAAGAQIDPTLAGGEIMLIGPDSDGREVEALIAEFPQAAVIHVVTADRATMAAVDRRLVALRDAGVSLPRVCGYLTNVLELPADLAGRIDLVVDHNVFDVLYFNNEMLRQVDSEIERVLKIGGIHIESSGALGKHLPRHPAMHAVSSAVARASCWVKVDGSNLLSDANREEGGRIVGQILDAFAVDANTLTWQENDGLVSAAVPVAGLRTDAIIAAFNLPESTRLDGALRIFAVVGAPFFIVLERPGHNALLLDLTDYYGIGEEEAVAELRGQILIDLLALYQGAELLAPTMPFMYAALTVRGGLIEAADRPREYRGIDPRVVKIPILPGVRHLLHSSSVVSARAVSAFAQPNGRVLIVGSSNGLNARIAAERGAIVDATDINPMAVANTKLVCEPLDTAYPVNAFANDLFDGLGAYDLIVFDMPHLTLGAEHLPSPDAIDASTRNVYDVDGSLLERVAATLAAHLTREGHAIIVNVESRHVGEILADATGLRVTSSFFGAAGDSKAYIVHASGCDDRPTSNSVSSFEEWRPRTFRHTPPSIESDAPLRPGDGPGAAHRDDPAFPPPDAPMNTVDELSVAVGILGHGGPFEFWDIYGSFDAGTNAAQTNVNDSRLTDDDRRALAAVGHELHEVREFYETIKVALDTNRHVSSDDLPPVYDDYSLCLDRMDAAIVNALTLLASLADKRDDLHEMSIGVFAAAAHRYRANIQALRVFLGLRPTVTEPIALNEWLSGRTWLSKGRSYEVRPGELDSDAPNVLADEWLLHIALERIVSNGFHAIGRHAKAAPAHHAKTDHAVTIGTRVATNDAGIPGTEIVIRNVGHVLEDELEVEPITKLQQIFILDRDRPSFSHGIGLSFTAFAIHDLGGTIRMGNITGDDGEAYTETVVWLPAAPDEAATAERAEEDLAEQRRERASDTPAGGRHPAGWGPGTLHITQPSGGEGAAAGMGSDRSPQPIPATVALFIDPIEEALQAGRYEEVEHLVAHARAIDLFLSHRDEETLAPEIERLVNDRVQAFGIAAAVDFSGFTDAQRGELMQRTWDLGERATSLKDQQELAAINRPGTVEIVTGWNPHVSRLVKTSGDEVEGFDHLIDASLFADDLARLTDDAYRRVSSGDLLLIGPGRRANEIIALLQLFPQCTSLTVVDASMKNLLVIKETLDGMPDIPHGKIKLYHGDLAALPFDANRFDVVYSRRVIDRTIRFSDDHLARWTAEIARVLKPDGVYLTLFSDPDFFETAGFVFGGDSSQEAFIASRSPAVFRPAQPAPSESLAVEVERVPDPYGLNPFILVATHEGAEVGSIWLSIRDDDILLTRIDVRTPRRGVGELLLRRLVGEAWLLGRRSIGLKCFASNTDAIAFYEAVGPRIGLETEIAKVGKTWRFTYTISPAVGEAMAALIPEGPADIDIDRDGFQPRPARAPQRVVPMDATVIPPMEEIGEKPWKLMQMAKAGLPVPRFFTITGNGTGDIELTDDLRAAFGGLTKPAIVRSAHPDEGRVHSFSGVFESLKGVTTLALTDAERIAARRGEYYPTESVQAAYRGIARLAERDPRVAAYCDARGITDFDPYRMNAVVMEEIDLDIFGMFITSSQANPDEVLIHYQIVGDAAEEPATRYEAAAGGMLVYNKKTGQLGANTLSETRQAALCRFGEMAGKIEALFGLQQIELGADRAGNVHVFQARTIRLNDPDDVPRLAHYETLTDDFEGFRYNYGYHHLPVLVIDSLENVYPEFFASDVYCEAEEQLLVAETEDEQAAAGAVLTALIDAQKEAYRAELLAFQREHPAYILMIKDPSSVLVGKESDDFSERYTFLNQLATGAKVEIRNRFQRTIRHAAWECVDRGGITIMEGADAERYNSQFANLFTWRRHAAEGPLAVTKLRPSLNKHKRQVSVQMTTGKIATGDRLNVLSNRDGIFIWAGDALTGAGTGAEDAVAKPVLGGDDPVPAAPDRAVAPYKNIDLKIVLSDEEIEAISVRYGYEDAAPDYLVYDGLTPVTSWHTVDECDRFFTLIKEHLSVASESGIPALPADMAGEEVMLIGPDGNGYEVGAIVRAFPRMAALHIVVADKDALEAADRQIEELRAAGVAVPPVFGYLTNLMELPDELTGRMGLIVARDVIDTPIFNRSMIARCEDEMARVVRHGGVIAEAAISRSLFMVPEEHSDIREFWHDQFGYLALFGRAVVTDASDIQQAPVRQHMVIKVEQSRDDMEAVSRVYCERSSSGVPPKRGVVPPGAPRSRERSGDFSRLTKGLIESGQLKGVTIDGGMVDGEVMLISRDMTGFEAEALITAYPQMAALHLVVGSRYILKAVNDHLDALERSGVRLPKVFGYVTNVMELPADLTGRISLVTVEGVFDPASFDRAMLDRIDSEIARVLKPGGLFAEGDGYRTLEDARVYCPDMQVALEVRMGGMMMDPVSYWCKTDREGSQSPRKRADQLVASLNSLVTASHLDPDAKVLISRSRFTDEDIAALRTVLDLDNGPVRIMAIEEIQRAAMNQNASKEKLACIVGRDEFAALWKDSHIQNNRASLIVLENDLKGENYLYLEGVVGFAHAVMQNDRERINRYAAILFGAAIPDDILDLLKDANPVNFALKTILRFKPIIPLDPAELEVLKKNVEEFLKAA